MLANTSRTTLRAALCLALVTAVGAGCQGHATSATSVTTSPVAGTTYGTSRVAIPIAVRTGTRRVVFRPLPRGADRELAKGIGAMGGPAGREDLRPDVVP